MSYASNWIFGDECDANESVFSKYSPIDGRFLGFVPRSKDTEVRRAIDSASIAFPIWSDFTSIKRGELLFSFIEKIREEENSFVEAIQLETGKSKKDAHGDFLSGLQLATFFASEGMRLYSNTMQSGVKGKHTFSVRSPIGICALIVPANTPFANISWKLFPALICGNVAVLKASEHAPRVAHLFGESFSKINAPKGTLNILHGLGNECGQALIEVSQVDLISFTGSTAVGRMIAVEAGKRLARVSLELGGKNPFIVCRDADIDQASKWACLSSFSNAGQRCSASSRIIVEDECFDQFLERFLEDAKALKLGVSDDDDLGPLMSENQVHTSLRAIEVSCGYGGILHLGGTRNTSIHPGGYYLNPTIIEVRRDDPILNHELFSPVACLIRAKSFKDALDLANSSKYGLTSAIHTRDLNNAMDFAHRVRAGVANINMGTFGSEPHIPFGGFGWSGNGSREPGTEAIDVYSELKCISYFVKSTEDLS